MCPAVPVKVHDVAPLRHHWLKHVAQLVLVEGVALKLFVPPLVTTLTYDNNPLAATIALAFVLPAPGVPVIRMFGRVRVVSGGVSATSDAMGA